MNVSRQRLSMFKQYTVGHLFIKQIQSIIYSYRKSMYSNKKTINELDYTSVHSNYVLKILNNKKTDYSKRYEIPTFPANELHSYREKNGTYKSLNDVLQVEGMTKEILDKFILSIINDKQYEKEKKFKKSIVLSSLKNIQREKISTILGIYMEANIISWTLLESKENVLDWNFENFIINTKNKNILQLLNLANTLKDKIPEADVYVVNDTNFNFRMVKSVTQIQAFLQKEQLKSMILAFLTQKNLSLQKNNEIVSNVNVCPLKCENIAQLFDVYVGKEITSTAEVIKRLLCQIDETNLKTKDPVGVYIKKEIMQTYDNQMDCIKDQMNWSLLMALTFLQLGVLQKYDYNFV